MDGRDAGSSTEEAPGRGPESTSLGVLASTFLRLGATGFGGPAAHVALFRAELVEARGWLSRERFLELWAVSNLLPGPSSTELALHLGHERRGTAGMLVAGTAFIAPGALASLVLAWTYARYGALPAAAELAAGLRPALAVVVAHAAFGMATTALAAWPARLAFGAALAMGVAGAHEIAALVAAGLVALASSRWLRPPPGRDSDRSHVAALQSSDDASATSQPATSQSPAVEAGPRPRLAGWLALAMTSGGAATAKASALGVFVAFAKVGSLVFGSGYVLFAFLRAELVARRGWATEAVVADAIAAGQLTPGPVFSAATFLGHHLAGWQGALAATLGVFAPAFVFVSASGPLVARIRGSSAASAALGGVAAGSLALVALVVTELARTAIAGPRFLAISAVATIAMARGWAGPTTVLVGGAAASLGAYAFGLGGASW